MPVLADLSDMPDLSWVGAAVLAAIWFVGAFVIVYRSAVAFNGRESVPRLFGAGALMLTWTAALTWLALNSLPD